MTIKVIITNDDSTKILSVTTVEFQKGTSARSDVSSQLIDPGKSASFYVHMLRDLRVSEGPPK
jgi:hypothetical protein